MVVGLTRGSLPVLKNSLKGSVGGGDRYGFIVGHKAVTMVPLRWPKSHRWHAKVAAALIVKIF